MRITHPSLATSRPGLFPYRLGDRDLGVELLLDEVLRLLRIDPDARAHRRRQRDALDVAALRGSWFGPEDLVHHREVIVRELLLGKGLLPDDQVEVAVLVRPVLDPAPLDVRDGLT